MVIITGRREHALKEAQEKLPGVHIKVSDASKVADRVELAKWAMENFPQLNILVRCKPKGLSISESCCSASFTRLYTAL